jgi:hypothetical protein
LRFANIIGSSGSVIETFKYKAEKGEAIRYSETASRYFISEKDAVEFIWDSVNLESGIYTTSHIGKPIEIKKIAEIFEYIYDAKVEMQAIKTYDKKDESPIDFDRLIPIKHSIYQIPYQPLRESQITVLLDNVKRNLDTIKEVVSTIEVISGERVE